jgi:hypothetical protein
MITPAGRPATEPCAYCHSPLNEDDTFCGSCGQRAPGRSDVPLAASAANEHDLIATAGSTVPGRLADVPGPLAGMADLPGPSPGPTGRAWPGTAEAPRAPVWPGSGELAQATEASVGQATPNSTYVGLRLQYEREPEASFDPLENVRFLRQLFFRAFVYWLVFIFGAIVAGIFFAVVGAAIGIKGALTVYVISGILSWLVLLCLYWLLPLPVLLSEWKFSVDGKGAAGAMAFEHIAWTLRQRETPLDSVQVRRLRLPGDVSRDYLELRRGLFLGYIACFPYGQDLYVGWTFYFRLSPLRWVLMFLARIWQTLFNRHTDIYVTLRYDSARAMREAMHSAAREGLDVAIGQLAPQGHGIIGGQVRVTDIAGIPG